MGEDRVNGLKVALSSIEDSVKAKTSKALRERSRGSLRGPGGPPRRNCRQGEDDQTRQLALDFGWIPVVPPRRTRLQPWHYDRLLCRRRNEVERLLGRLKGFRRIFSRFDKLDVMFLAFLHFALIVEALR